MATYLAEHPDIGMCPFKEVHHFGSDLPLLARRENRKLTHQEYCSLFDGVATRARVGEASVWYLYSRHAAQEIKDFAPGAGILIMLRNPVDALQSLHSQFLYNGRETVADFERALALDSAREKGEVRRYFVPTSYRAAVRYADQVERYLTVFGTDQVHIILFDDFTHAQLQSFQGVCRFLDVDSVVPNMRVVNPNRSPRIKGVSQLIARPPLVVRATAHALLSRPLRERVSRVIKAHNTKLETRPAMAAELRARLEEEFAPEIARLSRVLGIDLETRWLGRSHGSLPAR